MIKPCFEGEVMLAGWQESHTSGVKVTFWLPDPEDLDAFRGMTVKKGNIAGQRLMAVLVEIPDGEMEPEDKPEPKLEQPHNPNELARKMHANGYFMNRKLWDAMNEKGYYTYEQHREWVRSLPCIFDPTFLKKTGISGGTWFKTLIGRKKGDGCSGDIVAHHMQSAALPSAGKSSSNPRKVPHCYTVPLCYTAHHQNWAHHDLTREERHMLEVLPGELMAARTKIAMKDVLGISSLSEITQEMLSSFEQLLHLPHTGGYHEEA